MDRHQSATDATERTHDDRVRVDLLLAQLGRIELVVLDQLPVGDVLRQLRPVGDRRLQFLLVAAGPLLLDLVAEQLLVRVVQRRQREHLPRAHGDRDLLLVDHLPEDLDLLCDLHREPRQVVAVVVEDVEGLRGLMGEAVEVGEHLLEPVEVLRLEEEDGDLVLSELRVLVERGGDSGAAVLPVVDDELHVLQLHLQHADVGPGDRLDKVDVRAVRRGNRGEDEPVLVVEDVLGDVRDAALVEDALGAQLRRALLPVSELEEARDL